MEEKRPFMPPPPPELRRQKENPLQSFQEQKEQAPELEETVGKVKAEPEKPQEMHVDLQELSSFQADDFLKENDILADAQGLDGKERVEKAEENNRLGKFFSVINWIGLLVSAGLAALAFVFLLK